jgi:hypothetical protein
MQIHTFFAHYHVSDHDYFVLEESYHYELVSCVITYKSWDRDQDAIFRDKATTIISYKGAEKPSYTPLVGAY